MNPLLVAIGFLSTVSAIAPPHLDTEVEYHGRSRRRRQYLRAGNQTGLFGSKRNHLIGDVLSAEFLDERQRSSPTALARNADLALEVIQQTGKFQPLVLLMRFTDHKSRELPKPMYYDQLWNSEDLGDNTPIGSKSVKRYLKRNSYGMLDVHASITDWIDTDNTEGYYSFGMSGLTQQFSKSILPVLTQLDLMGYDFSQNDVNGDKIIDNLMVIHSGYSAEAFGGECETGNGYDRRIWSHAVPSKIDSWRSQSGFRFNQYTVASGLRGSCKGKMAAIGTMTHELMHSWGLRDLYDLSGEFIGVGTGLYSIMSNPYGWSPSKLYPPHLDPYSRMKLGWLNPIPITSDGLYTIEASALSPDVYIIQQGFPDGEFLLIENRQPIEYDELMDGSGILIWHIDRSLQGNRDRGYPGQLGWPGNGKHYEVAVLQADRKYDLENGNNEGDAGDFWTRGSELGPATVAGQATNPIAYPNTNSYNKGNIVSTGVRIYDFSESALTMTFRVSGLGGAAQPPLSTSRPSLRPTLPPTADPVTKSPTKSPTPEPTEPPSDSPVTSSPSKSPTPEPTLPPTKAPVTSSPTKPPTPEPTDAPVTSSPTKSPTPEPTETPSDAPITSSPSKSPTAEPTLPPTKAPVTNSPTKSPTPEPTEPPTDAPVTSSPSKAPTPEPTLPQTEVPITSSEQPSGFPTLSPSRLQTASPTVGPSSNQPSWILLSEPSQKGSLNPTIMSSAVPTVRHSEQPSTSSTRSPSRLPSDSPSAFPTADLSSSQASESLSSIPTQNVSSQPTATIAEVPHVPPKLEHSEQPSISPTLSPSSLPSASPSASSTIGPSSSRPSRIRSSLPTLEESMDPPTTSSAAPSLPPNALPSVGTPSSRPSRTRSSLQTIEFLLDPSVTISAAPSEPPTVYHAEFPSLLPSRSPTAPPITLPTDSPASAHPSPLPTNFTLEQTSDVSSSPKNTPIKISVLSNNLDPGVNLLEVTRITRNPSNGVANVNPDGTIKYTPIFNFMGSDEFSYEICDQSVGTCDTAVAFVLIGALTVTDPVGVPTLSPSTQQSVFPTTSPSEQTSPPSHSPTPHPSFLPTETPSAHLSGTPTTSPSEQTSPPSTSPTIHASYLPTENPSVHPSGTPTTSPSEQTSPPSGSPTAAPTSSPTVFPTAVPTASPTYYPTAHPSTHPTAGPSVNPSAVPTKFALEQTSDVSISPKNTPLTISVLPDNSDPIDKKLKVTRIARNPSNGVANINPDGTIKYTPIFNFMGSDEFSYEICVLSVGACDTADAFVLIGAVRAVTDPQPTVSPSAYPSAVPTTFPSEQTSSPSSYPTVYPSFLPTETPSAHPSGTPTTSPSEQTLSPSSSPTVSSTALPTASPTSSPVERTMPPSVSPTASPAALLTVSPSSLPSAGPSPIERTPSPSRSPTVSPVALPSVSPSTHPSVGPTSFPVERTMPPSIRPTASPIVPPTVSQSSHPSDSPTTVPSEVATLVWKTPKNTPVRITVLPNQPDSDGNLLNVTRITSGPSIGIVKIEPDGTIKYTPRFSFMGSDEFSCEICAPSGECDTVVVSVLVG